MSSEMYPIDESRRRLKEDVSEYWAPHNQFHVPAGLLGAIALQPRGEPLTYGATPLDRVATLSSQIEVRNELQQMTYRNIPDDVPLEIMDYVHTNFAKRFDARAQANEENYLTALYLDQIPYLQPEVQEMIQRARLKNASPAEILVIRRILGIRSAEVACLSHPYGQHIEMLDDMRSAAEEAHLLLGGTWDNDAEPWYRVKEVLDGDRGLLMTRKREPGWLPDNSRTRERSSFVLRTDSKGHVSRKDLEAIKRLDQSDPLWQARAVEIAHLDEIVPELLKNNKYSQAIPNATTIFNFNEKTARAVRENEHMLRQQRKAERDAEMLRNFPVIDAAKKGIFLDLHSADRTGAFNESGMLIVGPTKRVEELTEEDD